ncbi:MAG: ABC transporter substrate-binding protein [Clostridiales bacterium]|nr:ABC transporter substrate-binding protein [Clostridiales bacterium]
MLRRKIFVVILLVCLVGLLLSACVGQPKEESIDTGADSNNDRFFYTFTDSLENTVVLMERPSRVISLVGSYAETWLLAGGELVGVTNDVISQRKLDLPEDIDIVGTIKDPNLEKILDLSPDFVLLSPDIESHVKIADTLKKTNISHGFFKVEHFEEYLSMLDICTDITGNKDLYDKNGLEVKKQIDEVLEKADNKNGPDILFIRAMSSGAKAKNDDNMACRIFEDLGAINIAAKHDSLLEDLSMEIIIQEDPEYIFVVTMGDSQKAIEALKEGIEKNPAWSNLSAVKDGRYIVLPKDLFHYKPNARWGESYEYMAKIFYPENFK